MKQYDDIFTQMDKVFEEMDKAFKSMEKKMEEVMQESNESVNARAKWEPHTLKLPKRIGKRLYWPGRQVYRKFQLSPGGGFYVYGTEFDVLKSSK